jgi:hypothetical protein
MKYKVEKDIKTPLIGTYDVGGCERQTRGPYPAH